MKTPDFPGDIDAIFRAEFLRTDCITVIAILYRAWLQCISRAEKNQAESLAEDLFVVRRILIIMNNFSVSRK